MWICLVFYLVTIVTFPCNCSPNQLKKTVIKLTEEFTAAINQADKDHFEWIEEYQIIFDSNIGSLSILNEILVKITNIQRICGTVKPETIPVKDASNEKLSVPREVYIQWLLNFWKLAHETVTSMIDTIYDRGFGEKHNLIMKKMLQSTELRDDEKFHFYFELDDLYEKTKKTAQLIRGVPAKFDIRNYQAKLNGLDLFRTNFRKIFLNNKGPLKNMAREIDELWRETFESPLAIMVQASNEIKKGHQEAIILRDKLIVILNGMFQGTKFEAKNSASKLSSPEDRKIDEKLTSLMSDCRTKFKDDETSLAILSLIEGTFLVFLEVYLINLPKEIQQHGLFTISDFVHYKVYNEAEICMPPLKFQKQRQIINDNVDNLQNFLYSLAYGDVIKTLLSNLEAVKNGRRNIRNLNDDTRKNLQNIYDEMEHFSTAFKQLAQNFFDEHLNNEFEKLKEKLKPAYQKEPIAIYQRQNTLTSQYLENNILPLHNDLHKSIMEMKKSLDDTVVAHQRFCATFERFFKVPREKRVRILSEINLNKHQNTRAFDDLMDTRLAFYSDNDPSRLILNTLKSSHNADLNVLIQIENNLTRINAMEAFKLITPFKMESIDFQFPEQGYLSMIYERHNELFEAFENLYKAFRAVCFNANFVKLQKLIETKLIGPGKCPPINLKNIKTIDKYVSDRNEYRNRVLREINVIVDIKPLESRYLSIRTKTTSYKYNETTLRKDNNELETMIGLLVCENDRKTKRINGLAQFIRSNYVTLVDKYLESICNDLSKEVRPSD